MTRTHALLLALLVWGCSNAAPERPAAERADAPIERAEATITPADMYERIAYLASDAMRGRDTPSPELDRAAEWIAARLDSFGLRPGDQDGDWIQRYPYPLQALDAAGARIEVLADGSVRTLTYGTDYFAQAGRTPAEAVGAVFVGDAIEPGMRLRGRAAVVRLPGVPQESGGGYRFPRATRNAAYQALTAAEEAGAAAVVFVLDERVTAEQLRALARTSAKPARSLGGAAAEDLAPASFFLTRSAAARLFAAAGLAGPAEIGQDEADPNLLPLSGVTLRLAAPLRIVRDDRPPNVVGVLPGSDPELRDTYVVLSAHMDHVGVGRPVDGDSIYNGADDDASGTAALIEVAEAMASMPDPPARSLLFLAVSGEEQGLLGSRWFSDHPTVPIDAIVANLNLDMIGRNAPDTIVVIGQEYSSLGPLVHQVAADADLGLTVSPDIWPEQRFFFRSDHFNFARKEIPALFFFAGTHEDYHRPGDEVDDIDTDKAARVARLVFRTAYRIATERRRPEWTADGLAEIRRLTR